MGYKSGFIAIVGRPNAGKSTLLNAILKEKIMITSPKAQTTRNNVSGILTKEDVQYIFIDTPGIHKPQHELGKSLNKSAYSALRDADVIFYIVDGNESFGGGDRFMLEHLKDRKAPVFLLLNKVDLFKKEHLIKLLNEWNARFPFTEMFPISAKTKNNIETLLKITKKYLPEGPQFFPTEMKSDHPRSFLLGEIIREKVLYKTEEEIPHSVAVIVEDIQEKNQELQMQALIIVERPSQKGIIIGKQGSMIKDIGSAARRDLELMLGKHVYLELYVKVEKDWRNNPTKLQQFGYSDIENNEELNEADEDLMEAELLAKFADIEQSN
ncbi:MAG: GTPase Era [Erysipelotrichaceae bacterium]